MLRLRSCCILTRLLSSPAASSTSPLHRLLSAPAPSPSPCFSVQQYLVDTCSLTTAQAAKASTKLSHLKSPTNPDAVLAILAGLGLSTADVAALVAKDPRFLCARVETTLAPVVLGLTGLGLSNNDIARLLSLVPSTFRCRSVVSNLQHCLLLYGSYENLLRAFKFNNNILRYSFETTIKPNIAILRDCGLGDCDIAKLSIAMPRMLTCNPERFRVFVACAQGLGVSPGSPMFRHALHAVALLGEDKISTKLEHLKKTFRWSDAEVRIAVCKAPMLLTRSKDMLQSKSQFLISELGLEPAYIAHRPVIINLSLEGRLRPRYYVLKLLKEKRLLHHNLGYYTIVQATEKVLLDKYISPHSEAAPHLAQDYAAACRGEVPARFVFA
jgi:mTERF domain-containing protein